MNDPEKVLMERAGRILALREHGREELRVKLGQPYKGAAPSAELVEATLDRLEALGLLSDARYAALAAARLARKGVSREGIRRELLARGVEREAVEAALPSEDDDAERLAAQLTQPAYTRKLADEKGRRAVFQAMLRKGYAAETIRRALRMIDGGEST